MRSAAELKQIFQAGWNIPARVENYVRQASEFTEGESHVAWRATLERALATRERQRILDVGTGPGFYACLYAQMGHAATGLDFSERMLGVARQRAKDLEVDVEFVFGDAEEPPFVDVSFDAVSSRHLLFNLPRPGVAVRRWVRLLKPGGRMILMGNENEQPAARSLWARSKQVVGGWYGRTRSGRAPGWKPAPGYLAAVAECPLFRHGSRTLRVVMEAVGLEDIHCVASDEIRQARAALPGQNRRPLGSSSFFILVGVKPTQRKHPGGAPVSLS
jgi:ubiquinone/menaquinone biosynthesis C-methylase UbiE